MLSFITYFGFSNIFSETFSLLIFSFSYYSSIFPGTISYFDYSIIFSELILSLISNYGYSITFYEGFLSFIINYCYYSKFSGSLLSIIAYYHYSSFFSYGFLSLITVSDVFSSEYSIFFILTSSLIFKFYSISNFFEKFVY